jgi:osmotically-inducible protein OsmY
VGGDQLPDEYLAEDLRTAIATSPDVHEQAITVTVAGGRVLLTGSASTPTQRDAIGELVARLVPEREVVNDVEVPSVGGSAEVEELR